jgi:hypothetical protein
MRYQTLNSLDILQSRNKLTILNPPRLEEVHYVVDQLSR